MNDEWSTMVDNGATLPVLPTNPLLDEDECLKDRKWWAFLLSSIFTFLAGIFIILLYRLFAFCFTASPSSSSAAAAKKQGIAAQPPGQIPGQMPKNGKPVAGALPPPMLPPVSKNLNLREARAPYLDYVLHLSFIPRIFFHCKQGASEVPPASDVGWVTEAKVSSLHPVLKPCLYSDLLCKPLSPLFHCLAV